MDLHIACCLGRVDNEHERVEIWRVVLCQCGFLGSNTERGDSKAMSIVGGQHEGLKVNPVSSH